LHFTNRPGLGHTACSPSQHHGHEKYEIGLMQPAALWRSGPWARLSLLACVAAIHGKYETRLARKDSPCAVTVTVGCREAARSTWSRLLGTCSELAIPKSARKRAVGGIQRALRLWARRTRRPKFPKPKSDREKASALGNHRHHQSSDVRRGTGRWRRARPVRASPQAHTTQ
jgi:hypothetical protein